MFWKVSGEGAAPGCNCDLAGAAFHSGDYAYDYVTRPAPAFVSRPPEVVNAELVSLDIDIS